MSVPKVDCLNYLSISHNKYLGNVRALALAKPTDYGIMREYIIEQVKEKALENIFNTFFYVLSDGTLTKSGPTIFKVGATGRPLALKPSYPDQKIQDFCLSATKTLDLLCTECIDKILPDQNSLISARFAETGKQPEDLPVA